MPFVLWSFLLFAHFSILLFAHLFGSHSLSPRWAHGKGGYGVVFRGTLYGGVAVAMKRLDMHVRLSEEGSAEFLDEIQLLAQLRHPSIVQFIGFRCVFIYRYILNEFCSRF